MLRRNNKKHIPNPITYSNYKAIGLKVGDQVQVMRSRPSRTKDNNLLIGEVTRFDRVTGRVYIKGLLFNTVKKSVARTRVDQPGKTVFKTRGIHISKLWYINKNGEKVKISDLKKYHRENKQTEVSADSEKNAE